MDSDSDLESIGDEKVGTLRYPFGIGDGMRVKVGAFSRESEGKWWKTRRKTLQRRKGGSFLG